MKLRLLLFSLFSFGLVWGQANGVGQIWSTLSGTLQSSAVANGNGTALTINGLSSAVYTVNCSVACTGGTTINFEGSGDGSNYVPLNAVQLGTGVIATTVVNQGTTITAWQVPIGGLQTIRARISAYSAGTITVTANATAAPYDPKTIQSNVLLSGTAADGNSGNKSAATQRVVIATDQPQLTAKLLVTPDANVKVNVVGNSGANVDGATGAAPPANVLYIGTLKSGATGGLLSGVTACDSDFAVNISTATTTLAVTGVSGRQVRICHMDLVAGAADNVAVVEGTGATCGTGTAGMNGGTTAASGWNFSANGGIATGNGIGEVMTTVTAGDSVCIITSAAAQLSGHIKYAIY